MPSITWSRAMTANQLGDTPLANWQYERVPNVYGRAFVEILQRATTVGVRTTISTGSTTIQQRSNVNGGGTAGVQPIPFNTPPIQFIAMGDDKLSISNDEVAGGTPTVDGIISLEPA